MSNQDQGCRALAGLDGLDENKLHRFVVGRDATPTVISPDELDDPFARLLRGDQAPPRTADEVVTRLQSDVGANDPRARERTFLVGEGSQLPPDAIRFSLRTIRFVDALGGPEVDLILSASHPDSTSVEVMAWDATRAGFNYYRTANSPPAWVFGGNSVDAVRPDTEGKGPFESHTSGSMLMKELRFPWVHWHTLVADAPLDRAVMEGRLSGHRWLRDAGDNGGTLEGAEVLETKVVIPSIVRWTRARFDAIRSGAEPLRPRRVFEQVLATPTINLVSSRARGTGSADEPVDLPPQFFVDSETLIGQLGLAAPPDLVVRRETYDAVLAELKVRLEWEEQRFTRPGDTFFAFLVPERAFEDIEVVKQATGLLLTERLAGALLMVDFSNPVFSRQREALLSTVPSEGALPASPEEFSELVAQTIRDGGPGPSREEFLAVWDAGDAWREAANERLNGYYEALTRRLAIEEVDAFRDWYHLAESRRREASLERQLPIFEFPLLLPTSDVDDKRLVMRPDATVSEG